MSKLGTTLSIVSTDYEHYLINIYRTSWSSTKFLPQLSQNFTINKSSFMTTTTFGFVGKQKRNDERAQQGANTPGGGDRSVSAT